MSDATKKPAAAPGLATTLASIVNGCFGDYLSQRDNGLAIDMAFYVHNCALSLTPDALCEAVPEPTGKLCVLVHGLCCHEGAWDYPGKPARSYGSALHDDLGYTPFFLRYNTGLPIPYNGAALDALLEKLLAVYPLPVEEVILIGHSMGGLVLRGACHFGAERGAAWVSKVSRVFYIGTPHEGAALEQLGHLVNSVLHAVPNPITHLLGDVASQRSQGIKDLRHGTVLDGAAGIAAVPWLAGAQHYMIAGTVTDDPGHLAARLFGDGLVQPPQAGENVRLFPGIAHMELAHSEDVYDQIRTWCASA